MFTIGQVFIFENFQYNFSLFLKTCIEIHYHCWVLVHPKNYAIFTKLDQLGCTDSQGCQRFYLDFILHILPGYYLPRCSPDIHRIHRCSG